MKVQSGPLSCYKLCAIEVSSRKVLVSYTTPRLHQRDRFILESGSDLVRQNPISIKSMTVTNVLLRPPMIVCKAK